MFRLLAVSSLAAVLACGPESSLPSNPAAAPPEIQVRQAETACKTQSPIKHVVVLMMENRSFDHFLGWLPGADGKQAGLTYADATGGLHSTWHLAPDYQGCSYGDPDHSYTGGRVEYDNGKNDGWLRANDIYSIGYYEQADLGFMGQAAGRFVTADRYYPSILSETFPNRIYQHAGQTDRISNTFTPSSLPTIWDRLAEKGVKGKYYYSDLPFLGLWGAKYVGISHLIDEFYRDAATGHLPEVAFVDGEFLQEAIGTGNDDHPHVDVRNGEAFMNRVYEAIARGPQWSDTLLIINFDEWGGFFDHVPPPVAAIPPATYAAGDHEGRLGFRVPAIFISPWSMKPHIAHTQYDHTSVLRLIEWNWGLRPLTVRDAHANNPAAELDFHHPNDHPPRFDVPSGPFGVPCPSEGFGNGVTGPLIAQLRALGFKIP